MRGEPHRQAARLDDAVGDEVRERHLGRRDQAQLRLDVEREEIRRELRQLPRAEQCSVVDEIRNVGLAVAVLLRLHVEHQLRERALQARERAAQHDEARAGKLRGGVEVHEAELLAQRDVIERREVELRRRAPAPQLDVVARVPARRHGLVQHVRQTREEIVELRGRRGQLRLGCRQRVTELADVALQRLDVAARGFRAADVLGALVARLAQALDLNLDLLALRLEGEPALAVELEAAAREICDDRVEVLAKQLDVEHIEASTANGRSGAAYGEALEALTPALEQPKRQCERHRDAHRVGCDVEQIERARGRHRALQHVERDAEK